MVDRIARAVLAGALLVALTAPLAHAQTASIGTNPPGSLFYSIGSGIAKVVTDAGKMKLSVQPYAGSSTFLPLLSTAELEFGVNNAVDMNLAYRGPGVQIGGRNPFPHTPNARLVLRGGPNVVGLLVRKDSPIKTIQDIRGKRMTGEYPAHIAVWYNMFGHLASAGLTWNDVKIVPVPAVNEGVDALVQGRADVTEHALASAKVREAEAVVGVRHVSTDCSPEGEKRLRAAVPGYYPRIVKGGSAPGVTEDTCMIAYDNQLVTGRTVADQTVYTALASLWDNMEKLAPIHPGLREWTRERAVDPEPPIPYHPAAVRFYKEKGVWKPGMDQVQQKLEALTR
jgi:TRAP transporter TAXI family solute receptor